MRNLTPALAAVAALLVAMRVGSVSAATETMVRLPAGAYVPFYSRDSNKTTRDGLHRPVAVKAFWLDRYPVTNAQFLNFVKHHPAWSRARVASIFADAHYLAGWSSDFTLRDPGDSERPITGVSWFAAVAYCKVQGKTLPTTDQWEYALADRDRNPKALNARILSWYGTSSAHALQLVQTAIPNGYGVAGMVGLVWEWTLDFNSLLSGPDLRNTGSGTDQKFCGGGSIGARDASDYASFMRYSMRSSLKASYTTNNLGFRCALNAP